MVSDTPYVREWQQWSQGNEGTDATIQELYQNPSAEEKIVDITSATKAYHNYKKEYVKHLSFSPEKENLSKFILLLEDWIAPSLAANLHIRVKFQDAIKKNVSATTLEHAPLEAVYIYFDTASYDQIERDEKVIVEASHSHCMFTKKMIWRWLWKGW